MYRNELKNEFLLVLLGEEIINFGGKNLGGTTTPPPRSALCKKMKSNYRDTLISGWVVNLLKSRILGAKILSWVYAILIGLVYIFVFIYIISDKQLAQGSIQSLILVFITSFLGTYSKQYYESMIQMIFNFKTDLIPNEINKMILKIFALTNWLTLSLLSSFFSRVLKDYFDPFIIVTISFIPSLLYMVALFFSLLELEE